MLQLQLALRHDPRKRTFAVDVGRVSVNGVPFQGSVECVVEEPNCGELSAPSGLIVGGPILDDPGYCSYCGASVLSLPAQGHGSPTGTYSGGGGGTAVTRAGWCTRCGRRAAPPSPPPPPSPSPAAEALEAELSDMRERARRAEALVSRLQESLAHAQARLKERDISLSLAAQKRLKREQDFAHDGEAIASAYRSLVERMEQLA